MQKSCARVGGAGCLGVRCVRAGAPGGRAERAGVAGSLGGPRNPPRTDRESGRGGGEGARTANLPEDGPEVVQQPLVGRDHEPQPVLLPPLECVRVVQSPLIQDTAHRPTAPGPSPLSPRNPEGRRPRQPREAGAGGGALPAHLLTAKSKNSDTICAEPFSVIVFAVAVWGAPPAPMAPRAPPPPLGCPPPLFSRSVFKFLSPGGRGARAERRAFSSGGGGGARGGRGAGTGLFARARRSLPHRTAARRPPSAPPGARPEALR